MNAASTSARKFTVFIALAAGLIAADQLTKQLALSALASGGAADILPFLRFQLAFNRGAAFGFLARAGGWQTPLLGGIALALSVGLTAWLWHAAGRGERLLCCALALIIGGAIGNLIDRVVYEFVIDFIVLHHRGWQFPAFNLADSAISIGAALLIVDHIFGGGGGKKRRV